MNRALDFMLNEELFVTGSCKKDGLSFGVSIPVKFQETVVVDDDKGGKIVYAKVFIPTLNKPAHFPITLLYKESHDAAKEAQRKAEKENRSGK